MAYVTEAKKEERRNELYKALHDSVTYFVENGGAKETKGGTAFHEPAIKAILDLAQALNQPKDDEPVVVTTLKAPNTTNKLLKEIRKTICILQDYESRVYATLLNDDIDLKIGHTFVTYHMTEEEAEKAKLPTLEQKRGRKKDKKRPSALDLSATKAKRSKSDGKSSRPSSPKPLPTENDVEQKQASIIFKLCQDVGLDNNKVMSLAPKDYSSLTLSDPTNQKLTDFVVKETAMPTRKQTDKQILKRITLN